MTTGTAEVATAPALNEIAAVVDNRPGWSLWAVMKYFDSTPNVNFRGSQLYQRILAARVLDILSVVPPPGSEPVVPTPAVVAASVAAVIADARNIANQYAVAEARRVAGIVASGPPGGAP